MNVTWLLAWRNLWRHRRRTWLTVGGMIFCNTLLVFMISLQLGSYDMMIDSALSTFSGHAQVQHKGYQDDQKMRQSIPDITAVARQVREELGVDAVAARATGFALASSEDRSFGIVVTGVQPSSEGRVSTFPGLVKEGRFLDDPAAEEIVIGTVLARNLKVGVGDEVTFLGSGRDGSFAAGVATVVGIIDSGFAEADRSMAEVPLSWFQEVFAMGGHGHAVAIKLASLDEVEPVVARLRQSLAGESELVVLDWDALQPGLREAIRSDMTSAWFMYSVLIVLVAFSVLNTQLMSVLERTREFGVMMAVGMRPIQLARLVGLETLIMAAMGLVLGVLAGALVALYFSYAGMAIPGAEEMMARFNLPDRIYPQISALSLLWGPATVFLGTLLAAVYPAAKLLSLEPVAAMRAV